MAVDELHLSEPGWDMCKAPLMVRGLLDRLKHDRDLNSSNVPEVCSGNESLIAFQQPWDSQVKFALISHTENY